MSPSNRTIKVGGVWAQGAVDPPATPVQSTTYADSGVTEGEIQAGWPFADIVESAKFNEVMRRITSLIKLAEEWGVLPWNSSTTYATKALVMGSNGEIYYCKVASSTGNDPTTSPTQWGLAFEASGSVSAHAGLASPHSGQTPKTSSGSTTNTVDATGHTHTISAASETVKGAVELATAAETTAGTDNTRAVHPAGLKVELDKKAPLASPVLTGVVTAGAQIKGGFGATSTAGVADWNDVSNATSGQGPTLLLGTATNGPGPNRYFHAFTLEFSHKNGSGDMTQFAVPYTQGDPMYMRVRGSMTWGAWQPFVLADATQTLSNKTLASPTLTGVPATPTAAADTNTTQVASTAFVIGQAGTGAPGALSDGSAITGTSRKYSREDHRHPLTAASESTKGCVELATATETRTGTDNARAVHPAGLASMFNASNLVAGSGYVRIPDVSGGAIFQGGLTGTISSNGTLAVTFPAAFPTGLVSVVAVPTVETTSSETHIKVIAASTTGFTVQNYGTPTTAVRWMAIGK